MSWTAPFTFVTATALTAAKLNEQLRDNFLETMPAKASDPGAMFVVNSTGPVTLAERKLTHNDVLTLESTASTSYVDLATVGPFLSKVTGTRAFTFISARMYNDTANALCCMTYAVTGATTLAAADSSMVAVDGLATGQRWHCGVPDFLSGSLTAGTNVFTSKYRAGGAGTAFFMWRRMIIWPL